MPNGYKLKINIRAAVVIVLASTQPNPPPHHSNIAIIDTDIPSALLLFTFSFLPVVDF